MRLTLRVHACDEGLTRSVSDERLLTAHEVVVSELGEAVLVKITKIDCHVLRLPEVNVGATSSAQDDIVVEIHTDEDLTGIEESDQV